MYKSFCAGIIFIMRKVFDLHNDFFTELKNPKRKNRYIDSIKGENEIISAVWTSEMNPEKAMKSVEEGFKFVLDNNQKNKSTKLGLGVEDLFFVTKNNLARVINCCPRYCSLTWNYDNDLAGGALEGGDLTLLGEDVVRELEDNKIFVDTAHLNEKSFMSLSKITHLPILCTHTAVGPLVPNNRNLKEYQIKMVAESGGLMGLALVGNFLSGDRKATINDVARHIDWVVSRFGDDVICLGTDFYGTKKLPKGVKNYQNLGLIEDRLKFLGYSDQTIDKIFYQNAQKFFASKIEEDKVSLEV